MPTPDLSVLGDNPSQKQIVDYIVKLQRDLNWLLLNLDDLNVRRLTADVIVTGTLDANVVTIRSDLNGGAYIQIDGNGMIINNGGVDVFEADIDGNVTMTSATIRNDLSGGAYVQIDNNGLAINNGAYDTFVADINGNVTMTSALIQSSPAGFPRIVMDPTGLLFSAQTASDTYVAVTTDFLGNGPGIIQVDGGTTIGGLYTSGLDYYIRSLTDLVLESGTDIRMEPGGITGVIFPSFSAIYSDAGGVDLQSVLNGKANGSGISGTVFVASSSGGPTTTAISFSNGVRTS